MTRLSELLYRVSNWWTAAIICVLYAYFLTSVMPDQAAASSAYAGEWGAPDTQLFYTPDELYAQLPGWGEAGRQNYVNFRLTLDFVWAIAYAGFLVIFTSMALRRTTSRSDPRRLLNLAGLLPMLGDYTENLLGIVLVANHDTRLDLLAWIAACITAGKWVTLVLAHAVLCYALWMRLKHRGSER